MTTDYFWGVIAGGVVFGIIFYFMGRWHEAKRISISFDIEAVDGYITIYAFRRR